MVVDGGASRLIPDVVCPGATSGGLFPVVAVNILERACMAQVGSHQYRETVLTRTGGAVHIRGFLWRSALLHLTKIIGELACCVGKFHRARNSFLSFFRDIVAVQTVMFWGMSEVLTFDPMSCPGALDLWCCVYKYLGAGGIQRGCVKVEGPLS